MYICQKSIFIMTVSLLFEHMNIRTKFDLVGSKYQKNPTHDLLGCLLQIVVSRTGHIKQRFEDLKLTRKYAAVPEVTTKGWFQWGAISFCLSC